MAQDHDDRSLFVQGALQRLGVRKAERPPNFEFLSPSPSFRPLFTSVPVSRLAFQRINPRPLTSRSRQLPPAVAHHVFPGRCTAPRSQGQKETHDTQSRGGTGESQGGFGESKTTASIKAWLRVGLQACHNHYYHPCLPHPLLGHHPSVASGF